MVVPSRSRDRMLLWLRAMRHSATLENGRRHQRGSARGFGGEGAGTAATGAGCAELAADQVREELVDAAIGVLVAGGVPASVGTAALKTPHGLDRSTVTGRVLARLLAATPATCAWSTSGKTLS